MIKLSAGVVALAIAGAAALPGSASAAEQHVGITKSNVALSTDLTSQRRYYRHRYYGRHYWGPRRYYGRHYWGPRRYWGPHYGYYRPYRYGYPYYYRPGPFVSFGVGPFGFGVY
jgi:hypothetical protein